MAFLHADGRQQQNHHLWSDVTNHGTLFHFEWKKKINTPRKWRLFGTKSDIFTQPKVYDAKTKSLICQNGLFTTCLSLVYDVLDRSKSTSTYCWSHLLTNSGNLVSHLIHFLSSLKQVGSDYFKAARKFSVFRIQNKHSLAMATFSMEKQENSYEFSSNRTHKIRTRPHVWTFQNKVFKKLSSWFTPRSSCLRRNFHKVAYSIRANSSRVTTNHGLVLTIQESPS